MADLPWPPELNRAGTRMQSSFSTRWGYEPTIITLADTERVQAALVSSEAEDLQPAFTAFHIALQSGHPVSKFMLLYNVALQLVGGEQTDVDKMLRRVDESIQLQPVPGRRRNQETIFTSLRNDLLHPRRRAIGAHEIAASMAEHAERLEVLLRKEIELRLPSNGLTELASSDGA